VRACVRAFKWDVALTITEKLKLVIFKTLDQFNLPTLKMREFIYF